MEREYEIVDAATEDKTVFDTIRVLEGSIHLSEAIDRAHILYVDSPEAC